MNPMQLAQNHTARLVAEAATPVYSTETPAREHVEIVEVEHEYGFRKWVSLKEADMLVKTAGYAYSDMDHSANCWCFKKGN